VTAGVRIVLEVDSSEPLQGRLLADSAAAQPFAGWLGLMAALRQILGLTHTEQQETGDDR
jgi:hypothetical protein